MVAAPPRRKPWYVGDDGLAASGHIGLLVRNHRRDKRWSRETLAVKSGLESKMVEAIEYGQLPSPKALRQLADALDFTFEDAYPMPDCPTLGQFLRITRCRLGLSIADVVAHPGTPTASTLQRLEDGFIWRSAYIPALAVLYGVRIDSARLARISAPTTLACLVIASLDKSGMSGRELARRTNLGSETITRIRRGFMPHVTVIKRLGWELGFTVEQALPLDDAMPAREQLMTLVRRSGLTNEALAAHCGLSEVTVTHALNQHRLHPLTVEKLATVLPMSASLTQALVSARRHT